MRDFHLPGRSEVWATNGMCATSHPLAAMTAIDILGRGGNAMDAAIAAAVLLGLCEPQMTGLGGDCFVLYTRPGSEDVLALNGSGRAPAAADPAPLRAAGRKAIAPNSPDAVTIPGAVDAFCHLARTEGRIGLAAILDPAIRYAEIGVPVAPRVAADWARNAANLSAPAREFYLTGGRAPGTGQLFRAPGQAEILRRIAREGRDGFYTGEVAADMVASLRECGGVHTLDDFAATASTPASPVSGEYGSLELVEHPPNGQGAAALLMLNMLRQFDLPALDPLGAERAHIEAEIWKLAADARNRFIADPDHTARLEHLLAPETAARLAALIDPDRALPPPPALTEAIHRDTVYVTVIDKDRMAVSLIYSIFRGFGSGLASDRFGVLFHNRGSGFTLEPGHPNELGGGKRPMHTIIPAIVKHRGHLHAAFGVMGGGYQPSGHVRLLSNLVDFRMGLQQAVDAPRCFAELGKLRVERGYRDSVCQALADKGHDVIVPDAPIGGAQIIRIHANGTLEAASDPRKDGCALGY